MKKKFLFVLILMVPFLLQTISAQGPPGPPPPPPPGLAIDGGLFILLASGLIYGIRKVKK